MAEPAEGGGGGGGRGSWREQVWFASGVCLHAYVCMYMALRSGLSSCAWVVLKLCAELLMLVLWLLWLLVNTCR